MERKAKVSSEIDKRLLKAAEAPVDEMARKVIEDATRKYKEAIGRALIGSIHRATKVPEDEIISSLWLTIRLSEKIKHTIKEASR